eukprot:4274537-Pyramimonas_sp.AAC.1
MAKAAQYTPKMQSPSVEAVQIAHEMFALSRGPFHDRPRASSVLVTNARGLNLGGPAISRQPGGRFVQPPSGGWMPCARRQCQRALPTTQ